MSKPICGIYKITNKINGKVYIGQSIDIKRRWKVHCNRNISSPIHNAIKKYGVELFEFQIIETCSISELNEKEKFWIKYYGSQKTGYNISEGGEKDGASFIKISETQLLQIIDLLQHSNITQNEIAQRFNVGIDTISEINNGKTRNLEGISYPIREQRNRIVLDDGTVLYAGQKNLCPICGNLKYYNAIMCINCSRKNRKSKIKPPKKELENLIFTYPFTTVGKMFGVTDNAVRR